MNRLTLRRNPVSLLLSPGPWAAAWYLFSYLFTGTILFTAVVAGTAIAVALSFTVVGLPLLIAAAAVIRAAAHVERVRTRVATGEPVRGRYREVTRAGLLARVATQWRDPAVWRDLAYLLGLYGPLLALDWAVFSVWLTLLAGVTVPAWYGRVTDACVGTCSSATCWSRPPGCTRPSPARCSARRKTRSGRRRRCSADPGRSAGSCQALSCRTVVSRLSPPTRVQLTGGDQATANDAPALPDPCCA
jgi:hypothetical protein